MRNNKIVSILCAILIGLSFAAIQAKADTWYLNSANENLGLTGNFASVDISVINHTAIFTVDPNEALLGAGRNFGVQSFYFNTALSAIDVGDFGALTGWGAPAGLGTTTFQADGFGRFEVSYVGTGNNRMDPLTFTITDNSITSALDFFEPNIDGHHFAAHIAGFTSHNGHDSAFFTDGNSNDVAPVPEPSTFLLIGAGLMGLVIFGKRRMNS